MKLSPAIHQFFDHYLPHINPTFAIQRFCGCKCLILRS
jgi:hypothetical protein